MPSLFGIRAEHNQYSAHPALGMLVANQLHLVRKIPIAVGANVQSVLGCVLMAEKAAEIFVGAAAAGGPCFLPEAEVTRIAGRLDEAYRRAHLNSGGTAEWV